MTILRVLWQKLSVNSRLSSKEAQGSLIKEMIAEAEINEEEAGMIIFEHLDAIATVEKIHDDEKSRQVMALEMRLEERKALAQEMVRHVMYTKLIPLCIMFSRLYLKQCHWLLFSSRAANWLILDESWNPAYLWPPTFSSKLVHSRQLSLTFCQAGQNMVPVADTCSRI